MFHIFEISVRLLSLQFYSESARAILIIINNGFSYYIILKFSSLSLAFVMCNLTLSATRPSHYLVSSLKSFICLSVSTLFNFRFVESTEIIPPTFFTTHFQSFIRPPVCFSSFCPPSFLLSCATFLLFC